MPKEISGLRIARSFITPTNAEASRELDFQLGPRQGIAIKAVMGAMVPHSGSSLSTSTVAFASASQTLHLETGSLENVPLADAGDEDTIDSEVFYRQELSVVGTDDATTEFRASVAVGVWPSGIVVYPEPIFAARNITHRGIADGASLDFLGNVIIFYTFVEFALAELGLILARRT